MKILKIVKGIWNSFFGSKETKTIAELRKEICQSNKCGYYDQFGQSEKVIYRGEPACAICGCAIKFKVSVMEENCALSEINQTPLWTEEKDYEEN